MICEICEICVKFNGIACGKKSNKFETNQARYFDEESKCAEMLRRVKLNRVACGKKSSRLRINQTKILSVMSVIICTILVLCLQNYVKLSGKVR